MFTQPSKIIFTRSAMLATAAFIGAVTMVPAVGAAAKTVKASVTDDRQFTPKAGSMANEAVELISSGQTAAALGKLNEALYLPGLNAYERSTIYQIMGSAYYEQDEYGPAISAFDNAINAGGLLPEEADTLRANTAQLMIANGQYEQGATALENYLSNGGEDRPYYAGTLAQAWVQAGNYQRALPWAEKWHQQSDPADRQSYELLSFIYTNLNMDPREIGMSK